MSRKTSITLKQIYYLSLQLIFQICTSNSILYDMEVPYTIIEPKGEKVPIIVSVPHCGIDFPTDIAHQYNPDLAGQPDDTDWYVHQLYNFVSEMGITMIHAKYSRWVIDLNRDPESKPLYNDGRIITALSPATDFFGNSIYTDDKYVPTTEEIERRLENYYWPYYKKIEALLEERKQQFGKVLLWDAHSIRQFVPTIRKDKFPDLILGNNDEKTADSKLIRAALDGLGTGDHTLTHNTPFKGGHITRYFGKPEQNVHALQLEMTKLLYMDDEEMKFDEDRANAMRTILKDTFTRLIDTMPSV